jgi:hypothetical protein
MSMPTSHKFTIKPYNAVFQTQPRNSVQSDKPIQTIDNVDPQEYYSYLLQKYAKDVVEYYENIRKGADKNKNRVVISTNMTHLHIGNDAPSCDNFDNIIEYIQVHGSVKYTIRRFSCAQNTPVGEHVKKLHGCDGSNNLSASNIRCWRNKLAIECGKVSLITSDITDNLPYLCLFILLTLENNCNAIIRLHNVQDNNIINADYIAFLCSKFHECEIISIHSRIYLYCRRYTRDEHIVKLIKKLLSDNFVCAKTDAIDAFNAAYAAIIGQKCS